ncbi:MAG: hypothetical protein JJU37_11655 [Balneolaceae bacterium]|nr:hypothetical protein [Balneolaceae bacterium]
MNKVWTGLILLLALEMALVYPAHIIIDHSGLFGHHHHHDHPYEDYPEDDLCLFCVNMGGMEHSEVLITQPAVSIADDFSDFIQSFKTRNELSIQTRAPPFGLNK